MDARTGDKKVCDCPICGGTIRMDILPNRAGRHTTIIQWRTRSECEHLQDLEGAIAVRPS